LPVKDHLDEVSDCIAYLETQGFSKPLVHLIDREGDSVGHIRRWEAAGCFWLVRVKDNPKVEHESQALACKTIAQTLIFEKTRQVIYHGKQYWQWVAETPVRLTRRHGPAKKKLKSLPSPANRLRRVWWSVAFCPKTEKYWRNGY